MSDFLIAYIDPNEVNVEEDDDDIVDGAEQQNDLVVAPNGLTEEEIFESSNSVEQQSLPDDSSRWKEVFEFLSAHLDGLNIPTVPSPTPSSSSVDTPCPLLTVTEVMDMLKAALSCPPATNDLKGLVEWQGSPEQPFNLEMFVVAYQIFYETKKELENEVAVLTERRDRLLARNKEQSVPQPSTPAPFVTNSENGMEGSSTVDGRTTM